MRRPDRAPTPEQTEIARWTASLGAITAEALAHRTDVGAARRARSCSRQSGTNSYHVCACSQASRRCSRSPEQACACAMRVASKPAR